MSNSLTLRPAAADDAEFLYAVYAGTRSDELAQVDWSEAQKESFLQQQFAAQDGFYRAEFAAASFQVILQDGRAVGRLYVDRRADEIRIVDIALLPEFRGAGIGSRLLSTLLAEAEQAHKPVRIHVERFNPAMRLYQRLGFVIAGDSGVHFLMERLPQEAAGASDARS